MKVTLANRHTWQTSSCGLPLAANSQHSWMCTWRCRGRRRSRALPWAAPAAAAWPEAGLAAASQIAPEAPPLPLMCLDLLGQPAPAVLAAMRAVPRLGLMGLPGTPGLPGREGTGGNTGVAGGGGGGLLCTALECWSRRRKRRMVPNVWACACANVTLLAELAGATVC